MKAELIATAARVIRVYGIVQGVGFRPFVSKTACALGIKGWVANKGSFVEIKAQGSESAIKGLLEALRKTPPERSAIIKIEINDSTEELFDSFRIIDSKKESGDIFVSPDIATCDKCREELFDKNNRRYLHPFINCTNCGPRLTILESLPYDRERTTMADFPMCDECEYEYTHSETRRYDAQPVCCNSCGPELYIIGQKEKNREAITTARKAIMEGKIIAVKGIGGFLLCCNAKDQKAVSRLRRLKNRPTKPFAVMLRDIDTAKRECAILPEQEKILTGHEKPIILLPKKANSSLCNQIAPDNPTVGVMLPYTPVHMLLFEYDDNIKMTDCLLMTSGNVSGAPICRNDKDAISEIRSFCDLILSNNRRILLRADDSVMDFFQHKPYMIRRSRGYAPLPFLLSETLNGQVIGIGGELKNSFCIGKGNLFYLSPYVGDLSDIRTITALKESITRMKGLLEAEPQIAACDLHPGYNSVMVAEKLNIPVIRVQHHWAHVASCMAENNYKEDVIGVCFDGTGYGTDGSIWGGEFLRASYRDFERLGSICPFTQPGGDSSAREGWKIAVSMLCQIYGNESEEIINSLKLCTKKEMNIQRAIIDRGINTVSSTSSGRLFDAVSAVLSIKKCSTFEGEAAMALQFAAENFKGAKSPVKEWAKKMLSKNGRKFELSTDLLFRHITDSVLAGIEKEQLAFEFHSVLSEMITEGCKISRDSTGLNTCALSGGVFQNKLLTSLCVLSLEKKGFKVLLHSLTPPNDGAIALGQAVIAMTSLKHEF
ncbi:MAG: carbamoyltransferase HypF [Spirochaetales bacterium]|nr:carbamoyltransferase HypF [Spirochaetales bacterium]